MKFYAKKLLVFVTLAGWSLGLQAIEIGSVADDRFQLERGWSLDGDQMTRTRAKLLNPENFGAGGIVTESVSITDLSGPISYNALTSFDIFFIGYFLDEEEDKSFTADELQAMLDWVTAGGTMIITCDSTDLDDVCSFFGPIPSETTASEPVNPTPGAATRPIFDGPFGQVAELDMAGLRKYFDDTGGFMVLAEDQMGQPVILEVLVGLGRIVAFTDVDMIANNTLSPGSGITNDNDRFLGNLVAYLASESVETFFLNPGLNGNWWSGPTRGGEGAQLETVIDAGVRKVILTFYGYSPENNQIFLIGVGNIEGNNSNLEVFITDGGLWGGNFDPQLVEETAFGSGFVSSENCESLSLTVTPNETFAEQGYTAEQYSFIRLAQPGSPCPLDFVETE